MDWQPIENAPKDGTVIIIADNRRVDMVRWGSTYLRSNGIDQFGWTMPGLPGSQVLWGTHWMPLPTPPKEQ